MFLAMVTPPPPPYFAVNNSVNSIFSHGKHEGRCTVQSFESGFISHRWHFCGGVGALVMMAK
jgi:hypothetical protein